MEGGVGSMKAWRCLIAVSLLGVAACSASASSDSACIPPTQKAYEPVLPDLRSYFPARLATEGERAGGKCHPRLPPVIAEMVSSMLADLKEPVISTGQSDALRFVWTGSYGGYAVVRIEPRDGGRWLVSRHRPDGFGGLETRTERALSDDETARLDALLAKDPFRDSTEAGRIGLDGSEWLLEQMEGGHYQLVQRWSPEKARVRETGLYLSGLAGFGPPQMY